MSWFQVKGSIAGAPVVVTWAEQPDALDERTLRKIGETAWRVPSRITLAAVFVDGPGATAFATEWEIQRGKPVGATPTGPGWAAQEYPKRAAYVAILALLDPDRRRFFGDLPELPGVDVPAGAVA